jgi:hypothetical protein
MKIVFIQTYPVYHDFQMSAQKWLKLENRDKWMPAILAAEGYEVELWGVAQKASVHLYQNDRFPSFPIRFFQVSKSHRRTKKDYSIDLVEYAKKFDADIYFLKGVDGGAGIKLLDQYILPHKKPFVFVIGGKFYNKYVPSASGIFYETPHQKHQLMHPGLAFFRRKIEEDKLIFLPKSIDTDLFRPITQVNKEFDIISAGRLIPRYKNYDPLGEISNNFKVALIGDGPIKKELQKKYPRLHLLGHVSNNEMPKYLNKGKIFFHAGVRDFFPRVIPEAMATALPCIGFRNAISEEVIPKKCGLRVKKTNFVNPIKRFIEQPEKIREYGQNARNHVIEHFGLYSSKKPMLNMLNRLNIFLSEEDIYVGQ